MRKKYLSALLFGALLFASAGTFTSCKDYDDDIDNLQSQIDKVVSDLASLKSTVDNLNVGVTSVTVDGDQLVVVTNGATAKMNLPVGVQVSEIEIKDGHLYVGGVDKGAIDAPATPTEKAQKVEVKEDGFLYIDDVKQEGLHVGTDVVIKDASNGVYTITIGKETITLPMASANNLYKIVANNATFAVTGANGIAWAKAAGDVDWKGPKGAVAKDQLLIGMQEGISVTVLPYSYNLAAQDLKLVDSDGKIAPVTLVATKTTSDNPEYGPRASLSGTWTVKAIMDNTITADNIATAFTTNVGGADMNVKYALSVNGVQQTDFNILVDTYKKTESDAVATTCDVTGNLTINGSAINNTNNRIPVGESTLGFVNKDAYDCYLSFEGTYIAMAREMGVSVDGMNIKVDPKAGLSSNILNVTLHVMNVKGKTKTKEVTLFFGKSEISSETIATTTYNVMPSANGFATLKISLGDVLASMSDAHAESVIGSGQLNVAVKDNGTKFITNLTGMQYVKSFQDNGTPILYNATADDVRAIKYITIPVSNIQPFAEKGDYTLVFTIQDQNTNEIKKVEMPVSITLPTFDELFTKSASWDGSTLLLQLNNAQAANYLTAYQLGAGVRPANLKIATEAKYGIATSPTFDISAATDAVKNGAVQEFKAKSQYTIGGKYVVESDEYTIKLLSPLNDAAIVNYANDTAAGITISGTGATLNAYTAKNGLKFEVGGEKVPLTKNITVNGVLINNSNVKFSFDNAGATAVAELTNTGIKVSGLAPGNYTTNMTVKITDGNGIVTTIVLPIKVN